jgi:hypothetical protein
MFTKMETGEATPDLGGTSLVGEPSFGINHEAIFWTGNWYAAMSGDNGETFNFVNPYDNFPADGIPDAVNDGFCCDQVTHYDEGEDAMFWLLQYLEDGITNTQRIAVAPSREDVLNNTWFYYDFTPADFGFPAEGFWLDFPDLAVSDQSLYHTTNVYRVDFNGQAHGTQTANTLQDTQQSWDVNQFAGARVTLRPGLPSQERFDVLSNTATTLTIDGTWTTPPSPLDDYTIGGYGGTVIARYPLAAMAAGNGFSFSYWQANRFSVRCTQGATNTMYFAAHNSNTSLRVYNWPEGSGTISWDDVTHAAYTTGVQMDATGPDGRDFAEFSGDRLLTAWVADGVLGFMWNAAQGGSYAYPQTRFVRLNQSDRTLLTEGALWNPDYAIIYPSVHPNDRGHLAGTVAYGGATVYPSAAAWIADDLNPGVLLSGGTLGQTLYPFVTGEYGPTPNDSGKGRWGDYLTTRRNEPYGNTWGGSGFALIGGPDNSDCEPHYVWFGRQRDLPCILQLDVAEDTIVRDYEPPDIWAQEGVLVDHIHVTGEVDLYNLRFTAETLQCSEMPCGLDHVKKIHSDMIEFNPPEIPYVPAYETVTVEVKITVPIGQHACTYMGRLQAIADVQNDCVTVSDDTDVTLNVAPVMDMDIADNHGNVSDNVLHLKGAKGTQVAGTFTVVNPNSWDQNVDFADGPGNIMISPVLIDIPTLVKVGDPAMVIPKANISVGDRPTLESGESGDVTVTIDIPDGIPVNAFYVGELELEYADCTATGQRDSDSITLQVEVLPTQGVLDIVQTGISGDFCPDDPWTAVGQVALSFDVHAYGDHRNIRVASGGLKHESIPTKLDQFNFYPEEIAFLAAGETRTINVITKIPIGQNSGSYRDYFRVVSENGGEDSVMTTIDICELYDMDIKDDYANVIGNVMEIQAYARANQSGGEWALRAFDMGLPAELVGNHDEYDGPGNTAVDCITCRFAEWSPMWHEADPSHNLYSNFAFTGKGTVMGDTCDWGSGEFRRMLVGMYVPPMLGGDNHPGTYKGRLDCYAVAGEDTVSTDSFDIEVHLARVVGKPLPDPPEADFVAIPTSEGAALYWGDFRPVGIYGSVNLYRLDPLTGAYERLNPTPLPQNSQYLDTTVEPGETRTYRLGVWRGDEEVFVGPLSIGGNPKAFNLAQNAPNPFGERTTIAYELPKDGKVTLRVFDLNGRLVRVLKDVNEPAGFYTVTWDRRDDAGRETVNGVYFYRLDTPGFTATKKMLVIN